MYRTDEHARTRESKRGTACTGDSQIKQNSLLYLSPTLYNRDTLDDTPNRTVCATPGCLSTISLCTSCTICDFHVAAENGFNPFGDRYRSGFVYTCVHRRRRWTRARCQRKQTADKSLTTDCSSVSCHFREHPRTPARHFRHICPRAYRARPFGD